MNAESNAMERDRASLELLYSISRELAAQLDLSELLPRVLQLTLEEVGAHSGSIIVLDEKGTLTEGAAAYNGQVLENSTRRLVDPFERGLAGWVFEHRQAAFVPSTHDDDRWLRQPGNEFDDLSRSAISVPLVARDRVVGVLTMVHPNAGHFGEEGMTLLQAIADQAGIAVERARLFTAEQKRRRFSSTLQEIARTINSTIDPELVFPQILEQLERLIAYDSASILVKQDDQLRLVAARGFADYETVLGLTIPLDPELLVGCVLTTGQPMVVDDVQQDDRWIQIDELPETSQIRGWIGAPLVVRDHAVGVLNLDSHRVGAYGSAEVEVVSAFADQAAAAVANAQLYGEIQRRVQAMVALAETARVVTSSLNLDEVLQHITQQTKESLYVEGTSLWLLDEVTGDLEFKVASGKVADNMTGIRLGSGEGVAGWIVEHDEPLVVPDVRGDPRFSRKVDEQVGFETRAIAGAPIRVKGRTIGVLEAVNPLRDEFMQEQIELLMGIAAQAGSAITHAQLFTEIQAAQLRYAGLFEDSVDPILITDLNGTITDANRRAETFLGYPRKELLGRSVLSLHRPDSGQLPDDLSQLKPGQTVAYESQADHSKGHPLAIEVHAKRIDIGQQPFMQWILRDISERLELEELRTDLISMVFHDLRSPLGNILSSLEVMQASISDDDEAGQSVLSIAQRSGRRASRLVESLLDLDRLEAGQAVLEKTRAAIDVLITEAVEEVHPTAEAKGHVIKFDLASNMPDVEMDVDMIRRVLINLVENAVKHTRGGGHITVAVREKDDHIIVGVKDSGKGIPPRDQQRIFEKFSRIGQESRLKGRGIGLAFCRLAIEAHGGRIWVESGEKKGSTFLFSLPI
ncbi:MAG: GAF domain-containing protein [Anaerolineales bacterium]